MTTQDWTIECDLADQRKMRGFDIDLDVVTVTNEDNEFLVEISDEIIPNEELVKIVELMKKEYAAELNRIEPLWHSVRLVFSSEDKEVGSQ